MQKRKPLKKIPAFSSEAEEAVFWDKANSTEYFSGEGGIRLRLPLRTIIISFRIPRKLLERLKKLAQLKDVPYQSLLKIYLDEKVRDEIAILKKVA
ncbi:MAG: hypothetical protein HY877_04300 [Deltaproteobacteria bacterium]|nr:hypothetical protein [Deltaproteobacteria bacterium]